MPTYEYRCKDCGEHLEVVQKFTDDALTECPNCGGPLRKVFGNIGITFKGSGFYKTDNRSSGKKAETKSSDGGTPDKKAESSSSDSSSKSSDSSSSSSGSSGSSSSSGSSGSSGGSDAKSA